MCGIAGYYGAREIPETRRAACMALMRHRGPDASGEAHLQGPSGRHLHLLHSRLSIIDLKERANQPFRAGSGRLVFNGEIYNYLELRQRMLDRGIAFETESDTEVLARLLAEKGRQALDACEGMWAFAWYDESDGSLLLSRDRFGEKPLYVHEEGGDVYFGSEPEFVFALLGGKLPVNMRHLYRYLVNGYKSLYKGRETFFEGLTELAPGTTTVYGESGAGGNARYWSPAIADTDENMTYEAAVSGAREALTQSVKLRLRADVPVAFCLSGGVDSNALISIAKRTLGHDVHGFTIINTDARYEETDLVAHTVSELGLKHTAVPIVKAEFLPNLRKLIRQRSGPVYTITYYAHWQLMQAVAAEGYKVSVSGTAADELFSGYFDHHNAYLYDLRNDKPAHLQALENWRREIAPLVRNPFLQDPDYFVKNAEGRDHIYLNAEYFAGFLTREWSETFAEEEYCAGLLRNRMANELFHESVPVILREDDFNAMYYSIENRSPYLDRGLFDWCQKIPTRHLIQNGRAKAVLRDAVRGLAPERIVDNPRKVGFNAPILDYLDLDNAETRATLLDDGPIFEHISKSGIESLMEKSSLPNSESKFLFNFINAKMFLEEVAA